MRVAVCVLTYKRPKMLSRALASLCELRFARVEAPELTVIVVDNDELGSGRAVCEAAAFRMKFRLRYLIERRRGISCARNAAVLAARTVAEWVAFVDDDETVDPSWLDNLMSCARSYGAQVVAGPVKPRLPEGVARWIVRGRFFERRRHRTGTVVRSAITASVLFSLEVIGDWSEPFSNRFALMGGEDAHFFRLVHMAGKKIVWCDDALVSETVPSTRTTVRWIVLRAYRTSMAHTVSRLMVEPRARVLAERITKTAFRLLTGITKVFPLGVLGRHVVVYGLTDLANVAGTLSAFLGLTYEEYRATHGS